MIVVGLALGIACRLMPEHYQGPCNVVVRALALVVGVQ